MNIPAELRRTANMKMVEELRKHTAEINETVTTHNVIGWFTLTHFHGTLESVPSYNHKMATYRHQALFEREPPFLREEETASVEEENRK